MIIHAAKITDVAAPGRTGKDNSSQKENCHDRHFSTVNGSGQNHGRDRQVQFSFLNMRQ